MLIFLNIHITVISSRKSYWAWNITTFSALDYVIIMRILPIFISRSFDIPITVWRSKYSYSSFSLTKVILRYRNITFLSTLDYSITLRFSPIVLLRGSFDVPISFARSENSYSSTSFTIVIHRYWDISLFTALDYLIIFRFTMI